MNVGDMKKRIMEEHLLKPKIERQRILFGGRLLRNDELLKNILKGKNEANKSD